MWKKYINITQPNRRQPESTVAPPESPIIDCIDLICVEPSLEVLLKLPWTDRFAPLHPPAVCPLQAPVSTVMLKVSAPWSCSHLAPPDHYDSPTCDSSRWSPRPPPEPGSSWASDPRPAWGPNRDPFSCPTDQWKSLIRGWWNHVSGLVNWWNVSSSFFTLSYSKSNSFLIQCFACSALWGLLVSVGSKRSPVK